MIIASRVGEKDAIYHKMEPFGKTDGFSISKLKYYYI